MNPSAPPNPPLHHLGIPIDMSMGFLSFSSPLVPLTSWDEGNYTDSSASVFHNKNMKIA